MTDGRVVVGPIPTGRDGDKYDRERRRVLWALPTGLYVLGTGTGGQLNLMTISWVTQVSTDPKMLAIGVENGALSSTLLKRHGVFSLTVLPRDQKSVVRRFVKPVDDLQIDDAARTGTMNGEPVVLAPGGTPVLSVAAAWIECAVRHTLDLGSHNLFVGEVVDCGRRTPADVHAGDDTEPLLSLRMEDTRMNYGG